MSGMVVEMMRDEWEYCKERKEVVDVAVAARVMKLENASMPDTEDFERRVVCRKEDSRDGRRSFVLRTMGRLDNAL